MSIINSISSEGKILNYVIKMTEDNLNNSNNEKNSLPYISSESKKNVEMKNMEGKNIAPSKNKTT